VANPTVQDVINIARETANETAPGFWVDTAGGLVGLVNIAHNAMCRYVFKSLRMQAQQAGRMLDAQHPFLENFVTRQQANTVAGTQDYDLPDTCEEVLFVLYGSPLRPAVKVDFWWDSLSNTSDPMGASPTAALWAPLPSRQIRFYVRPGRDGVPRAATPYEIHYVKYPTRLTTAASSLDVPWTYIDGVVYETLGQMMPKERAQGQGFSAMARQYWEAIP